VSTQLLTSSESHKPDTRSAQKRRVEILAARLGAVHNDPSVVLEVCAAFDMAAEFAACEGYSVAEAVRQFFDDAEPSETRWGAAQAGLRRTIGWDEASGVPASSPARVVPAAVFKLLRTSEDSATVADLESIASSDPVMTARILSVANSARFASRHNVSVIREAILRIGIPEARKTLLAACFSGLFVSPALQEVWMHSQMVADLAWQFAGYCGVDRGVAYSAGLLHDIGRLTLLSGAPKRVVAASDWAAVGFPLVYAETLAHARDHAECGSILLNSWGLPEELVEAVTFHHRPERTKSVLAHVVFLAEDLTSMIENKPNEDFWSPLRRQICLDSVGEDARNHIRAALPLAS
jgi:putative nucleotidyltransferase with HDIG domain